jgi:hypothetical protein
MAREGRFRLAPGLALGASLAFLVFLLARPVDDAVLREADVATRGAPRYLSRGDRRRAAPRGCGQ